MDLKSRICLVFKYFSSVYVKLHIHILHSSVYKKSLDMLAVSSGLLCHDALLLG